MVFNNLDEIALNKKIKKNNRKKYKNGKCKVFNYTDDFTIHEFQPKKNIIEPMIETFLVPIGKSKTFKEAFGTDRFFEPFNINACNYILDTWEEHLGKIKIYDNDDPINKYDPKLMFETFIKSSKGKGYVLTKYNKSVNAKKYGRWFSDKGISLQNMPRVLRHTLCNGIWIDLDFKNCHPIILEHICNYYKISCHFLHQFNINRENMLKSIIDNIGCSRDDAKIYVLKTLNGGCVNLNVDWWADLKKEFINIAATLSSREEFKKIKDNCLIIKKENIDARVMNHILCIYENTCLEFLYAFLTDNNIIQEFKCCLIFDGLQVLNNAYNTSILTTDFLKDASIYIKEHTGIYLDIVIKPFDEYIQMPDNYCKNSLNNIKSYENVKLNFELSHFKIRHPPIIVSNKSKGFELQAIKYL